MALVNGKEQFVDQPPMVDAQTGRTLVPLRFIAQTLGNTVLWDGKRRKITILKKVIGLIEGIGDDNTWVRNIRQVTL